MESNYPMLQAESLFPANENSTDPTLYWNSSVTVFRDNLDQVRSELEQLEEQSLPVPILPLATLEAAKGHFQILPLCLKKDALSIKISTRLEKRR